MFEINYLSLIFMGAYLPVNFPSVAVIDKRGLRLGLIIGMVLTTVGLGIRCFINQGFYFALIG